MNEHEVVRLKEPFSQLGLEIPAGTKGTIVYVYQSKSAFEVEFIINGKSKVYTLSPNQLEVV